MDEWWDVDGTCHGARLSPEPSIHARMHSLNLRLDRGKYVIFTGGAPSRLKADASEGCAFKKERKGKKKNVVRE